MKRVADFFETYSNSNFGFEALTETEMQIVRGGTKPLKPTSRPRDIYDDEDQQ